MPASRAAMHACSEVIVLHLLTPNSLKSNFAPRQSTQADCEGSAIASISESDCCQCAKVGANTVTCSEVEIWCAALLPDIESQPKVPHGSCWSVEDTNRERPKSEAVSAKARLLPGLAASGLSRKGCCKSRALTLRVPAWVARL